MNDLLLIFVCVSCLLLSKVEMNEEHRQPLKYKSIPKGVQNALNTITESTNDYIYYPAKNGTIVKVNVKFDNATLQKFDESEKSLDTEFDNCVARAGSISYSTGNKTIKWDKEKFNFNNTDITFTLYTRIYTNGTKMENFTFGLYNTAKPTKVITHGYMSSGTADTCISLKNNFLNTSDVNVIILDWSKLADNILYPISAYETTKVAAYLARFLGYLIESVGVREEDLHLLGHSLGAHIVGFCGKRLVIAGFKLPARCTGLDPALPGFKVTHINRKNCKFVDIIHTASGLLGNGDAVGHVDFYPNGGVAAQPGCSKVIILKDICSHSMSWKYFATSILHNYMYMAVCLSRNKNIFIIPMGEATPPTVRGICRANITESEN